MKEYKGYKFYFSEGKEPNKTYSFFEKDCIWYFVTGTSRSRAPISDYFMKFNPYIDEVDDLPDEYCQNCIDALNSKDLNTIKYDHIKNNIKSASESGLFNFLNEIRDEYIKARKPVDDMDGHIIRGRSHSISSIAEDLLAICYKESFGYLGENLYVFVDRSISAPQLKIQYPDIIVARKIDKDTYKILALADLKQDVGWIRDKFDEISIKHDEYCRKLISSKEAFSYQNKGDDKTKIKFIISDNLRYDTLIISALNAGSQEKTSRLVMESDNQNNNILLLDRNTTAHPNEYLEEKDYANYMEPNYDHWNDYIYDIFKDEWNDGQHWE